MRATWKKGVTVKAGKVEKEFNDVENPKKMAPAASRETVEELDLDLDSQEEAQQERLARSFEKKRLQIQTIDASRITIIINQHHSPYQRTFSNVPHIYAHNRQDRSRKDVAVQDNHSNNLILHAGKKTG